MKWILTFVLASVLCAGCAVYADPYPASGGVYVAPPAVVVQPAPWEYHPYYYHEGWHGRGYWRRG